MNSMQKINEQSAKTTAGSGVRCAMFVSVDGMRLGYMAQTAHILAACHALPPSNLGNNSPLSSQHCSGLAYPAKGLLRMDGGFPECAADMKSTLRWVSQSTLSQPFFNQL
jgi:hypothetical protein